MSQTKDRRDCGFTLIELLIVIGILGLLMAALLPNLIGAGDAGNETATQALFLDLRTGCEAFQRKHGYFPPDDLVPRDTKDEEAAKSVWKSDNGLNTGIESLVAFLAQGRDVGGDFGSSAERFANHDKDDHGAVLPLLKVRERKEIVDAWGTPLAYFSATTTSGGFDKAQQIVAIDGQPQTVRARRGADGAYLGAGKYQFLSAGKDQLFGTDDDLVYPK